MFIGNKKIKTKKKSTNKSYLGNAMVEVTFESEDSREYLAKDIDKLITKKASTPNEYYLKYCHPIISDILSILAENNLTIEETQYVLGERLIGSLQSNQDMSISKCFGKKYKHNLTLMDFHRKLTGK